MPHLTSTTSKGTAFSRPSKTDNSSGTARKPPAYGVKGADQGPSFHIRPANDAYEQQADRIAEKITTQLEAGAPIKRSSEGVKPLKEKGGKQQGKSVSEKTAAQIVEAQGKGQPLPAAIRKPAEKALGTSLADVRLHTGAKASSLNREVEAEAFAVKKDIFVGNQLDLSRPEGREVALHEAVHTQQQKNFPSNSNAIQRTLGRFTQRPGAPLRRRDLNNSNTPKPRSSGNIYDSIPPELRSNNYDGVPPELRNPGGTTPQNIHEAGGNPEQLAAAGEAARRRRGK